MPIDPEDPFWQDQSRNGQQIREGEPYADGYKTKVKVKGKEFYRTLKPVEGSFSDYLASSNLTTQTQFFGGGEAGKRRALYFRREMDKVNKDPRDILVQMLSGPTEARKFIPLP